MRGLYIHIPFCRQACRYCDFFFSVSVQKLDDFVNHLVAEIGILGAKYPDLNLETLYIGGGTPSLLSSKNLGKIMKAVQTFFSLQENAEITMECNPDDLNTQLYDRLIAHGFNRLSIGIQSFHDQDLQLMRRSHDANQAKRCVKEAADAGFNNITIDLIYGIPGQTSEEWESNIREGLSLPISHLSAYHLTFEPGTVFDHWRKKGRLVPVHEEESVTQYRILQQRMSTAGFDHYEISNFALNHKMSQHNLLYWSGEPYLGAGPSAHSFDGTSRSWNLSSLKGYMEGIDQGISIQETERLSLEEKYHDYVITSLRTKWGADADLIRQHFGEKIHHHFQGICKQFIEEGSMWKLSDRVAIHPDRWLITDHIMRELFVG